VALFSASASAEPPSSPEAAQQPATVTVEAQRQRELIQHQISTYVSAIAMPNRGEALLRWQSPVCPAVMGLSAAEGEFLLERLSKFAMDAGAPVAPKDCGPNLLVIVSPEPNVLLKKWWARNPRLFKDDKGIGGVKRFLDSTQPIRAYYNANLDCEGGAYKVRGGGTYVPSHCTSALGSKLSWEVIRVIVSVIVIVDLKQISDLTMGQLTDYVTLISLAQIREDPNPGAAPTILHLFTDKGTTRPEGLSDWDQSFLKALYTSNTESVMQLAVIKDRLYGDLAH
jgi:hypothetical protein